MLFQVCETFDQSFLQCIEAIEGAVVEVFLTKLLP